MAYRNTRQKIVDIIAQRVQTILPNAEIIVDFGIPTTGSQKQIQPFTVSVQPDTQTVTLGERRVTIESTYQNDRVEITFVPGLKNKVKDVETCDREYFHEYLDAIVEHLCSQFLPLTPIKDGSSKESEQDFAAVIV